MFLARFLFRFDINSSRWLIASSPVPKNVRSFLNSHCRLWRVQLSQGWLGGLLDLSKHNEFASLDVAASLSAGS
jgi:hypothetical protein